MTPSKNKDSTDLLNNYTQARNGKININDNKEENYSSNFGQEKLINRENVKSYLSKVISNKKLENNMLKYEDMDEDKKSSIDNKSLSDIHDIVHGHHKAQALALIDQQNAIHETDDLVNVDKDHRYAHGENHVSIRKRKMSVQIGESQTKKKFKPNHHRRGSLGI